MFSVAARAGLSTPVVRVDAAIFEPARFFFIDEANRRVDGPVPGDVRDALGRVGSGPVASVVGRLRSGWVAVDVDVDGLLGDAVVELVCARLRAGGLRHVVRPSGGGPGRAHVVVACDRDGEGLVRSVAAEAAAWAGVPGSRVDCRRWLRPLSAPHRLGASPVPLSDPAVLLPDRVTGPAAERTAAVKGGRTRRSRHGRGAAAVATRGRVALRPARPRVRGTLPSRWARYLLEGVVPVLPGQAAGRPGDYSRSTVEAVCTAAMVHAGWCADQAWDAIAAAHPAAMTRARASHRRWLGVWNAAVENDDAHYWTGRGRATAGPVGPAAAQARARLHEAAWRVGPRARPALLAVGEAVLARVERAGVLRVPVPERDLVLDTGVTDRKTVRGALRALDGVLGVLHRDCLDLSRRGRSSSSFEFEINPVETGGAEILPPSFHTPSPRDLPPGLPPTSVQVLRALPAPSATAGADLPSLGAAALLTHRRGDDLTPRQARTLAGVLRALERVGLAVRGEDGRWRAGSGLTPRARVEASRARVAREEIVQAERAEWRAGGRGLWDVQRAAAVKRDHARAKAWWDGQTDAQREMRSAALRARFEALGVVEQARVKDALVRRDRVRGIDPDERRRRWLASHSSEELEAVSIERAVAFARLPGPERAARAAAWEAHRRRHRLGRG